MSRNTIVIVASYAPSLINFRGPLLAALASRNYRIVACAPWCDSTARKLAIMNVEFIPVALQRTKTNPFADLMYLWRLIRVLARVRPAAMIAYTAKPVIWGSLAACIVRTPRICAMITGIGSGMVRGGASSRHTTWTMELLYRAALSCCVRVAFQNEDDEREFIQRGLTSANKTFRVNGSGVLLAEFAPTPLPDAPVFLLIARLLVDKGIREYASAAALLKERYPAARFLLAGWFDDNPSRLSSDEVDCWVQAGLIEFVGRLEDVRPAITAARVYVLPSYREGTPRTVLEAMAMGRAVITTDAPGCRETVIDGWNGFLVRPRNIADLAAAMEKFLLAPHLAEGMGRRSRELATSKFDARVVASDLVAGFAL